MFIVFCAEKLCLAGINSVCVWEGSLLCRGNRFCAEKLGNVAENYKYFIVKTVYVMYSGFIVREFYCVFTF